MIELVDEIVEDFVVNAADQAGYVLKNSSALFVSNTDADSLCVGRSLEFKPGKQARIGKLTRRSLHVTMHLRDMNLNLCEEPIGFAPALDNPRYDNFSVDLNDPSSHGKIKQWFYERRVVYTK